jgi:hypothetical protein
MIKIIEDKIYLVRGSKVMLDRDLASLYGVKTKVLLQAVRRNKKRFPLDFMLCLEKQEVANLRSQFVTSSWGGSRYRSYAFTEQGIAMLSSVLKSERAIQVNIQIMRTFSKLRQLMASHEDLRRKIEDMECRYDQQFRVIFDAIKELLTPPKERVRPRIGFHS